MTAPPALTLPALLAHWRGRAPDRRAFVTVDDAVTYEELDDRSRDLADRLAAAGVAAGDRVGLLAPNGIDWVVEACAVARLGAVLVPLSTLLRPPELAAQLRIASVTHLVISEDFRGRDHKAELEADEPEVVARLRALWPHPLHGHFASSQEQSRERTRYPIGGDVAEGEDLVVLFTSGSRGLPKGVIHTHGGALAATAAGLDVRCVREGEVLYVPMPFFWTGGLGTGLLTTLVAGATLLVEAEPEPARTLAMLERERATLFRGWPDQAAQLAAHPDFATTDLSSLRDGSLTALLPPERRPPPGARANIFGMTETLGPYCGDRLDRDMPQDKWGSCGRPFGHVEVEIHDPETGEIVDADESGEIWLRGPTLLRGMCGRSRDEVFTARGWYRTGDLGRLDLDGYLWYSGRLDDMVKVKGATVYPSEVEAAVRALPGVREAHVTDIDRDGVRSIAALVVGSVSLDDVDSGVRSRLSSFKVPTVWHVVATADDVPRLASGKVDKAALQEVLAERCTIENL